MNICKTCGDEIQDRSTICVNCWEVELRLDAYLQSPKGYLFVAQAMHRAMTRQWTPEEQR